MGGTFDPIHHGHLIAAEEAREAFGLDSVVFVPAGSPWQKEERDVTSPEHRYRMTVVATDDHPSFEVSRAEVDRDGPTYTVETLRAFRAELGPAAELFFITGADAVLKILTWKDPAEALGLASFIAVTRPGYDLSGLDELGEDVRAGVSVLGIPGLAVSSTQIRERVRAGRSIRYLVPEAVRSYIAEHGLYTS